MQIGSAFAKHLFTMVSTQGAVLLRVGFAAIILLLFLRPRFRRYSRSNYLLAAIFGISIACMNALFYASLARLPLGMAVTIEFVGPLGVSLIASRRILDVVWIVLAAAGILLLAPIGGFVLDPMGVLFALLAGVGWGVYILLNVRVGQIFSDSTGLVVGMCVGALFLLPFGAFDLFAVWRNPWVWITGLGIAIFSTALPFSLEMEALRRLPARIFGVLLSLEPAIAALIGLLALGEVLGLRAIMSIILVVAASIGVSLTNRGVSISSSDLV
jgi:inner membrane transporter RhtA